MVTWKTLAMNSMSIKDLLGLRRSPVAVTIVREVPTGLPRVSKQAPAGCAYWKLAAAGEVFYATADDHFGCPIGAHVLGLSLPAEPAQQLSTMLEMMQALDYLQPAAAEQIPRWQQPWAAVVYAPVEHATGTPDVVIHLGQARQMMLLVEAVQRAGVPLLPLAGRPACAMVPAVAQSGSAVSNLGCIGNRVYTELGDDEFYVAIPGGRLTEVAQALPQTCHANRELETYHRGRAPLQLVKV